jgi:phosphatidylinositol-3-phosphatase
MICDIGPISRLIPMGVAILLVGTACQTVAQSRPSTGHKAAAAATTTPTPTPTPTPSPKHVFVVVLENSSYTRALEQPYISNLASQYAVATNYHDIGSPSLPNYLAMTSGSTWGIHDDGYHALPASGLGDQLTAAGVTWRAYFEGFNGSCFNSPYPYALKHNPFAYYGGQCPANIAPMTQLTSDLSGDAPQLAWITPGLCNDGHDCGVGAADRWLSQEVPQITGSVAWQQGGVLLITWDESSAGDGRVPLLVIASNLQGPIATPMDHFSLLATVEDELGVGRLGEAKQATSLADQLKSG